MKNIRLASMIQQQDVYGPPPEDIYNNRNESMIMSPAVYGPPSDAPSNSKTVLKGTNIIIAILIFVLGIIAIFNKKMSKKAKLIIISSLILIGIIITVIINYISNL